MSAGSPGSHKQRRTKSQDFQDGGWRDACPTLENRQTVVATPEAVREKFRRVKPFKEISVKE